MGQLLLQGARAQGFANALWTLRRIAAVMQVHVGVDYPPAHVWTLLRRRGWSCQVPERRALQRDEQAMAHGKRYQWPAIKNRPTIGAYLAFLDERGFLRMPTRRRTWAPAGHTPLLTYHDTHDRRSAVAALPGSPTRQPLGRYRGFQPRNFQATEVADCLRARLRHLRSHIILLWDRGSMHRGPAIEAVGKAHPRLHLEEFPA